MKFINTTLFTAILLTSMASIAGPSLDSLEQRYSYALGYSISTNLKRQNIRPDPKAFSMAMEDVMKNKKPRMTIDQMRAAMNDYVAYLEKKRAGQGAENRKIGEKFLAEYKKNPGVKSLGQGILYRALKTGKGHSPSATDSVTVHYSGRLINGTEFDSSYRRNQPATFRLNEVIRGWTIAVQKMKPGDKWEVAIPSDLAYGERGGPGGSIGPNETLIFEIELLKINK